MTQNVLLGHVVPEYHDAFILQKREQGLKWRFSECRNWRHILEPVIKVSPELKTDFEWPHSKLESDENQQIFINEKRWRQNL